MVLKKRVFLTAMEITPQKGVEFEPNLFRGFSRNPTYFPLCQKQDIQNRCLFPPCCFLTFSLHLKSCLLSKKRSKISPPNLSKWARHLPLPLCAPLCVCLEIPYYFLRWPRRKKHDFSVGLRVIPTRTRS